MEKRVAKTYAVALFDVAVEIDKVDEFSDQLELVSSTYKQYPEFYELFRTSKISKEVKKEILVKVYGKRVSNEVMNFLKILIDKGRFGFFKDIVAEYMRLVNEHKNIVEAVATSAIPILQEEKVALENKLSMTTGKLVKLKNEINEDIIGGILVRIGDKVIDGTIQDRLRKLQENLAQIIV
jgi:F-type H+-transporting ATPase subunit delta